MGFAHYPDGTVEVLEVKNHSPFRYDRDVGGNVVRDRDPPEEVPPLVCPSSPTGDVLRWLSL